MSKRRSGSSSPNDPYRNLTFFTDECVGKAVAEHLKSRGVRVVAYHDHYSHRVDDVDWIELVGRRGWVGLSKDGLTERPIERIAVLQAGARVFYLQNRGLRAAVMAEIFERALVRIGNLCHERRAPFVGTIPTKGDPDILYTRKDLAKLMERARS